MLTSAPDWHRIQAAMVDMDDLVRYVRQHADESSADKLRRDLGGTGRARIDGEFIWFEYEKVV